MCKQSVDTYFQEKLFMWLDEAWEEYSGGNKSDFLLGKIYAYVECLEIIMQQEGCDNDVLLALEEQYGIR